MRFLPGNGSVWDLIKPMSGLLVLGVLALAAVGVFMGIAGALISFAAWASLRILPILAAAALIYWIARELGLLRKIKR
jgi:hypothetical protein